MPVSRTEYATTGNIADTRRNPFKFMQNLPILHLKPSLHLSFQVRQNTSCLSHVSLLWIYSIWPKFVSTYCFWSQIRNAYFQKYKENYSICLCKSQIICPLPCVQCMQDEIILAHLHNSVVQTITAFLQQWTQEESFSPWDQSTIGIICSEKW